MAQNDGLNMNAWTKHFSRERSRSRNRSIEREIVFPRDAIVFIVGHSMYDSNTLDMTNVLQSTLLVGGINEVCYTRRDTKIMKMRIDYHFKDSLDLSLAELVEKANTMKNIIHFTKHTPEKSRKNKTNFKNRSGIFSQPSYQYYERKWSFYDHGNKENSKNGFFVRVLMNGKKGLEFVDLYKNDIIEKDFVLTKTELLNYLSENFNLKNVVIVDFGCTKMMKSLSEPVKHHLMKGEFLGGKKTLSIKRNLTRHRKRTK
jgi:hypothetical protein